MLSPGHNATALKSKKSLLVNEHHQKKKKKIFLFSKKVLPNSFTTVAWFAGCPFSAEEEETLRPEKGHTCSYSVLGSTFWRVSFSSAQLYSSYIAHSSTCAKSDVGLILYPQSLLSDLKSCPVSVTHLH